MRTRDTPTGYGWISIALHWLTAIAILTIWFIGSSIHADPATTESTLNLHTSIAISVYALLWARIIWRFAVGHPGPLPEQRGFFHVIGKYCHYVMLAAVGAMLLSGPLMAWSRGDAIHVWNWFALSPPFERSNDLF
ncbi:MAG TPA: cytochrome b/b6 domain-containing protein, partial [Polyangiales bacterium]|nr:cytochrome b/b6 domain-containing protein [Polyangiales bacterium]